MVLRHFLACLLLSAALILPTKASEPEQSWFASESWTLNNGLKVVLLPNHRSPLVRVNVWYKTGGANDPKGQSGVAHYLEHLMFRGNHNLKDGAYSAAVKNWGGQENAFTALDVTTYFATIPADKLQPLLKMEASRMAQMAPSEKNATTEHQVIQQERHQTIESDPGRLFSEELNALFYPDYVYGRPIIGTPAEIKNLTLDEVIAFHDTWYGPDNAVLVIAGDVSSQNAHKLVNRYFGSLKRIYPPKHVYLEQAAPVLNHSIDKQKCDARIEQPLLGITWALPSSAYDLQDSLNAQVLAYILNGGSTSPLYRKLVEQQKRVTALSISYNDSLRAAGSFDFDYWPSEDERDYKSLDQHVRSVLRDVIAHDVTQADVKRAIDQLKLQFEMASDEPINLAMQIGYQMAMDVDLKDIQDAPKYLDAVTLDDMKRFSNRFLFADDRGSMSSRLLPEKDPACAR